MIITIICYAEKYWIFFCSALRRAYDYYYRRHRRVPTLPLQYNNIPIMVVDIWTVYRVRVTNARHGDVV